MTDDEAVKEYEAALGFLLIYWNAPETSHDPNGYWIARKGRGRSFTLATSSTVPCTLTRS
jgi:hypothetical protein